VHTGTLLGQARPAIPVDGQQDGKALSVGQSPVAPEQPLGQSAKPGEHCPRVGVQHRAGPIWVFPGKFCESAKARYVKRSVRIISLRSDENKSKVYSHQIFDSFLLDQCALI
jgi:hypothetical protein